MEREDCRACAGSGRCWVCEGSGVTPMSRRACMRCQASGRCTECAGSGRGRERRRRRSTRFTTDRNREAAQILREAMPFLTAPAQRALAAELAAEFEAKARSDEEDDGWQEGVL